MLVQSNFKYLIYSFDSLENVLVAQLDACLTGDQKGAGLTLPLWQHSFMEIWSWNIFYSYSLPYTESKRAVVSFWQQKNVHNTG